MNENLIIKIKKIINDSIESIPGVHKIYKNRFSKKSDKKIGIEIIHKKNVYYINIHLVFIKNINLIDVSIDTQKRLQYEIAKESFFINKKFHLNIYIDDIN